MANSSRLAVPATSQNLPEVAGVTRQATVGGSSQVHAREPFFGFPWIRSGQTATGTTVVVSRSPRKTLATRILRRAAGAGQATVVGDQADRGGDVNKIGKSGDGAVHRGWKSGSVETMNVLLDRGADPNLGRRQDGKTALHLLLDAAAEGLTQDEADSLALMTTTIASHPRTDLTVTDNTGKAALDLVPASTHELHVAAARTTGTTELSVPELIANWAVYKPLSDARYRPDLRFRLNKLPQGAFDTVADLLTAKDLSRLLRTSSVTKAMVEGYVPHERAFAAGKALRDLFRDYSRHPPPGSIDIPDRRVALRRGARFLDASDLDALITTVFNRSLDQRWNRWPLLDLGAVAKGLDEDAARIAGVPRLPGSATAEAFVQKLIDQINGLSNNTAVGIVFAGQVLAPILIECHDLKGHSRQLFVDLIARLTQDQLRMLARSTGLNSPYLSQQVERPLTFQKDTLALALDAFAPHLRRLFGMENSFRIGFRNFSLALALQISHENYRESGADEACNRCFKELCNVLKDAPESLRIAALSEFDNTTIHFTTGDLSEAELIEVSTVMAASHWGQLLSGEL